MRNSRSNVLQISARNIFLDTLSRAVFCLLTQSVSLEGVSFQELLYGRFTSDMLRARSQRVRSVLATCCARARDTLRRWGVYAMGKSAVGSMAEAVRVSCESL